MGIMYNDRRSDGRRNIEWMTGAVFCVLGFITGAMIFSRSYTPVDINICREAVLGKTSSYADFTKAAVAALIDELPYVGGILLLSFFAFGWLGVPVALFLRGLSAGVTLCCLCSDKSFDVIIYAIVVIAIPTFFACAAMVAIAKEAIRISGGIFIRLFKSGEKDSEALKVLARLPVCIALIAISVSIKAGMSLLLSSRLL